MGIIAAIDPGLTGAVAWLRLLRDGTPDLLGVEDIPTAEAKQGKTVKKHLLLPTLANMLSDPPVGGGLFGTTGSIVIEEVHAMPGQGVTSMFRFGYVAGAIAGVAAGIGIPVHYVRPNQWQKAAGVRQGDDAGRLRANQLFPRQAHLFARKKDHNRADAALIGYAWLREEAFRNVIHTT